MDRQTEQKPDPTSALVTSLVATVADVGKTIAARPAPPPPDNSALVAMIQSQSTLLASILSKDQKPDNTLTLELMKLLAQKPSGPDELERIKTIKAILGGGSGGELGGLKGTLETMKAVKEVMGPSGGGSSELGEIDPDDHGARCDREERRR